MAETKRRPGRPARAAKEAATVAEPETMVAEEAEVASGPIRADVRQPMRKPLGSRKRLDVSHLENDPRFRGKKLGWFNNEAGRIPQLMSQGWEPVKGDAYQSVWQPGAKETSQTDSVVMAPVGIGREGLPINAILMMIDEDIYDDIQSMKEEHLDNIDMSLRQGRTGELGTSEQGVKTYAPDTGFAGEKGFTVRNE